VDWGFLCCYRILFFFVRVQVRTQCVVQHIGYSLLPKHATCQIHKVNVLNPC
jgi:hypothetical protein